MADLSDADLEQRLADPGIVRNRLKVNAVRTNARAFLEVAGRARQLRQLPLELGRRQAAAQRLARGRATSRRRRRWPRASAATCKKRGFTFVGPTIVYAYLQSTGVVNDHIVSCFRYGEV